MTISRRNLLKLTAAAVSGPAFLPVAFGQDAPNSRLRVGAIGVGGRGTYDAGLHMNLSGAEKMGHYIGAYLQETYDLEDHRGDPVYDEVYAEKIRFYDEMREDQERELAEYGELISY